MDRAHEFVSARVYEQNQTHPIEWYRDLGWGLELFFLGFYL